jgi:uncharacterized membrane protein YtjA (UPF0391 family)
MDIGAACGTGGVDGAAWGAAKVVDVSRGVAEVDEAGNK